MAGVRIDPGTSERTEQQQVHVELLVKALFERARIAAELGGGGLGEGDGVGHVLDGHDLYVLRHDRTLRAYIHTHPHTPTYPHDAG